VAGDKFQLGSIFDTGVLLFGRRTWELFATLWPTRDTPFAQAMNRAEKAVVTSRPLPEGTWANSHAVEGPLTDWIAETRTARDVVVIGSHTFVHALRAADLVDEYRLLTFPTAVGAGRRLFPDAARLDLVSSELRGPASFTVHRPQRS
jgi:dihydrofolate reductase